SRGAAGCGTIRGSGPPRDFCRPRGQRDGGALLRGGGPLRAAVAARGAADGRGRSARVGHAGALLRQSRRRRAARAVRRGRGRRAARRRRRARRRDRGLSPSQTPYVAGDEASPRARLPSRGGRLEILGCVRPRRGGRAHVTRAAGRALAAAILAALLASVLLAAFYLWHPALTIEFDADPPLVSGVYPVERDVSSGLTFAWTGQEMRLSLPGLDRRVAWNMDVRVRGARRQPADNPDVVFIVDGAEVLTRHTGSDFEDVRVAIPARPERPWGALVAVRSSSTFVPGPADPRPLGVMLDRLAVVPDGAVLP